MQSMSVKNAVTKIHLLGLLRTLDVQLAPSLTQQVVHARLSTRCIRDSTRGRSSPHNRLIERIRFIMRIGHEASAAHLL